MLGGAEPGEYEKAMKVVADDPNVDIIVAILVPQSLVNPLEVAQSIYEIAATTEKTVISCFMGDKLVHEPRLALHAHQVPMVVYPESIGSVLGAMYRYANWKNNQEPVEFVRENIHPDKVKTVLDLHKDQKSLGESLTRPILESYGIPIVKGELAKTDQEAAQIANVIGFPVVMKIVSKDILHKSDVGGIRLNLTDQEQVGNKFNAMMTDMKSHLPDAEIEGVLN